MSGVYTDNFVRHDANKSARELADEDLVEQFRCGDEIVSDDAFRALVERHGPMVIVARTRLLLPSTATSTRSTRNRMIRWRSIAMVVGASHNAGRLRANSRI
jgi:hypothetical protein